jgi:chromosome segregation ATPase
MASPPPESPKAPEAAKPAAVLKDLRLHDSLAQEEAMQQHTAREDATQLVLRFKKRLQDAALQVERKAENQQSRLEFLSRTAQNAEREKERLVSKLHQLNRDIEAQKDRYDQQIENITYQASELRTNYGQKIQGTIEQLKTLREFQEHKQKMEMRMRQLGAILARERKDRSEELTAIHRKLVAQRKYYEHALTTSLSEADEYATKFEDLDLDRATAKILQETEHRREALKTEHQLTAEVVKRNDQLRHQVQDLEQQRRILEESEKNLTMQAVDLKAKLRDTVKKSQEAQEQFRERLDHLTKHLAGKIGELTEKLDAGRKAGESLRRELALAKKQLGSAEAQRDERLKKDYDLLGVMTECAMFVLTSLELQEKDPSKDEVASHSSALNAVIRKIENVSQDLTGIQRKPDQHGEGNAVSSVKKFIMSGNPPQSQSPKVKPHKPKPAEDFRKNPEYLRIFGKDAGGPTATATSAKLLRLARGHK